MFAMRWFSRRRDGAAADRTSADPSEPAQASGPDQMSGGRPPAGRYPVGPAPSPAGAPAGLTGTVGGVVGDGASGALRADRSGSWGIDRSRIDIESVHTDMVRVDADMAALDATVDKVLAFLGGRLVPRPVLINPLLNVWEAARAIDATVSRPVERLLTTMMSRELISSDDVTAAMDDVRARAVGASVVANCVTTSGR